jgi:thiol-disulfide isomerase/thioredoxin
VLISKWRLMLCAALGAPLPAASLSGGGALAAGASLALAASLVACSNAPARAPLGAAAADWNASEVAWAGYEAGLAEAKRQGKPVLLVFYTDWCPHCHNYSRLFHDPEVVRLSRAFVMVRVERDGNRDISAVYAIDGDYIPRTFFLAPSGAVLTDLIGGNEEFRYFFDEHDPTELIAMMQLALERLGVSEPVGS